MKKLPNWIIFFSSVNEDFSVTRAECYFTAFIIEHNFHSVLRITRDPYLGKCSRELQKQKKYGSGRAKSTSIMRLKAKEQQTSLISKLQNQPFAIATDGSNDSDKIYPLVVTFFDYETCCVQNALLCSPVLIGDSTGKNIGNLIISSLIQRNIPLENCIAFGCDNANVMVGKKKWCFCNFI